MSEGASAAVDTTWAVRRRFFPAVEGMRGVAAMMVLLGHVILLNYLTTPRLESFGYWLATFGVVVFFVISGFLLYRPFLGARQSARSVGSVTPSYLVRRGVRIFPAYWVALTLLAIWPGLQFVFTGEWWRYYGLLQVYSPAHAIHGISVAWSLCVELSFYLVLPLLAFFLAGRGVGSRNRRALTWELGTIAGLAGLSLLFRVYANTSADTVYLGTTILGTFSWFSAGMLLAAIQVLHPAALSRVRRVLARPQICWPLGLALFGFVALEGTAHLGSTGLRAGLQALLLALAAACLIGPVTLGDSARAVHWALANRVAIFVGTVSYGIYLYHLPIMEWLTSTHLVVDSPFPVALLAVLSVVCAVALGTASWFLIEKPLMLRVRSVKAFTHVREGTVEIPSDAGPGASTDSPETERRASEPALASDPTT